MPGNVKHLNWKAYEKYKYISIVEIFQIIINKFADNILCTILIDLLFYYFVCKYFKNFVV